MQTLDTQSSMA